MYDADKEAQSYLNDPTYADGFFATIKAFNGRGLSHSSFIKCGYHNVLGFFETVYLRNFNRGSEKEKES